MDFTAKKIKIMIEKLKEFTITNSQAMDGFTYVKADYQPAFTPPKEDADWQSFIPNTYLTDKDAHFWFHTKFTTPPAQEGIQYVFHLRTGREGEWDATNPQCIALLNGKLTQGLDVNHNDLLLDANTVYDMYLNFYTGMNGGNIAFLPSLNTIDTRTEKLYYDISVPYDCAKCFEENDKHYVDIMQALNRAVMLLDLRYVYSKEYYESISAALEYLDKEFYHRICSDSDIKVHCIGHTHIDVAWLWTLAQTREKAQRSFSTVLNLMRQYPEYKFMSSQPQLYKYVKEAAPELYAEIKQAVKDGRWEAEGAMWLEADCNLTSGESLVRQILFGKRFMQKEFGVESKILWLPDVFGYSAALPQILQKSGVDKFVTSKISWNETNHMPFDTFMWEGIDGTNIFTYFMTARDKESCQNDPDWRTTYVGYIRPKQVVGTWDRYQPKTHNNEVMITYGFGDGGGGPTKDMLEQQRRLAKGIPGMPQTVMSSATDFLNNAAHNFAAGAEATKFLPKWVGELYLEFHRGTYTSIAKNKRNNRKSELLCQQAEALSSICNTLLDKEYPQNIINDNWETILLNQFHDIIPGSSIFEVYEDSDKQYAKVLADGEKIQNEMLSAIADNVETDGGVLVYNPHSHTVSDTLFIDGKAIYAENIPAMGWSIIQPKKSENSVHVENNCIENKFYMVRFNEKGDICSIFDKENNREIIKNGKSANQFCIFEDYPYQYDAWELSPYYKDKMWTVDCLEQAEILNEGARAGLKLTKTYQNSRFVQKIYLYADSRRIDFETEADWKEDHVLLKTMFPLDIHTEQAAYEIQFGHVFRPTHANTSWDTAKFEVCAQKWADMSEDDYGVSLLNDCKYGYAAKDGIMSLTLLKAATYPNPQADRGHHSFTYALYPHTGNLTNGGTVMEAQKLNKPLLAKKVSKQSGSLPSSYSFVCCENPDIIIETIKKAEDSNDLIIRLYESCNKRSNANITFGFDISGVALCNLMEQEIAPVEVKERGITIPIKPFEIVTLKIKKG